MTRRCRWRGGISPLVLTASLMTTGCRLVPVRPRIDAAGDGSAVKATIPASPAVSPTHALQAVSDEEALGTPMLDGALARAEAIQNAALTEAPTPVWPEPTTIDPPAAAPTPVVSEKPSPDSPAVIEPPAPGSAAPSEPSRSEPMPESGSISLEEDWRETLNHALELAQKLKQSQRGQEGLWATRERLLMCLTAESPPVEQNPLWQTVVSLLATTSEDVERPDVSHLLSELALQARLEVTELKLCQKVNGFGNYHPVESDQCRAGQMILLYCEMMGLEYRKGDDEVYQSRLTSRLEIRSESSTAPIWSLDLGLAEDRCRRPRRDYYVNYRFKLPGPELLPPGSYQLRLIQTDAMSGETAERMLTIHIVARP